MRSYRSVVVLALGTLVLGAGVAQAAVVRTPFSFHEDLPGETALPECLPPDLIGTQTGSEDTTGEVLDNGSTLHVQGTTVLTYRVDFPDGSYVLGSSTARFEQSGRTDDMSFVTTTRGTEPRTLYSADGTPIGTVVLHFVEHVTVLGSGRVTASIEKLHWNCR